jgi:membrane-bound metal-dependent hydrolase YbcI (DUF457 family)
MMATLLGHIAFTAAAAKLGEERLEKSQRLPLLIWSSFLTILPDFDVLAFKLGIPYAHQFGHRGFTHSIIFSLSLAGASYLIYCGWYKRKQKKTTWWVFFLFFIALISHTFLDMLTNGGLGCALYWPFDHTRHFFSVRPIPVSPIGLSHGLYYVFFWETFLILPILGMSYAWRLRKYFIFLFLTLILFIAYFLRIKPLG